MTRRFIMTKVLSIRGKENIVMRKSAQQDKCSGSLGGLWSLNSTLCVYSYYTKSNLDLNAFQDRHPCPTDDTVRTKCKNV